MKTLFSQLGFADYMHIQVVKEPTLIKEPSNNGKNSKYLPASFLYVQSNHNIYRSYMMTLLSITNFWDFTMANFVKYPLG